MENLELVISASEFITHYNQCPKCFNVLYSTREGKYARPGEYEAECIKCGDQYKITIKLSK